MKYSQLGFIAFLLMLSSPLAFAHDTTTKDTTTNSYTTMNGTHLLPKLTNLCFINKTTVEVLGSEGKSKDKAAAQELKELIEERMQSSLSRMHSLSSIESDIIECTEETYQSLTMAVLNVTTSVSDIADESGFYEIVVKSKLGKVFKVENDGGYARPYLVVTTARTLTRKKDQVKKLAVEQVHTQISALADRMEKEKLK